MPRRSEKRLYRCGRMALPAHKSLVEAQELASGHVIILSWVIMTKLWIWTFLRLLRLRCLRDKTSHRLQSENIADSLQSQTFDRRERKMSNLHGCPSGNLQCIASPMPLQDLLRIYHIRKIPNIATLAFDLNITYRAILNIELYKWQPQKRLQKLR